MAFFGNPKHEKKNFRMCVTTFWNSKLNFELKLSYIQWLDEDNWIKSMCIKYITYIFSTAIRPHVYGS